MVWNFLNPHTTGRSYSTDMTSESLERVILYVSEKKKADVISATVLRQNGHHAIANEHENEAEFAKIILKDLYAEQNSNH